MAFEERDERPEAFASAFQRYSPRPLTEGERWTADELAKLRRRGYRPRAWSGFIAAAFRRSQESRRERPQMARQAEIWGIGGAAAWIVACGATRHSRDLDLPALRGLTWWASVWQMLDWHLGMAEGGEGRPRENLSPADAITLARFWLVPMTFGAANSKRGLPAVILAGGISDWLDGAVARRAGRTRLGRDLDTTADLIFLTSAAVAARSAGRLPSPAFAALGARHGLGLALSLGAVFGRARRPAVRARPWGAIPRIGGLVICAAGGRRSGAILVVLGCAVPPRSTARALSPA